MQAVKSKGSKIEVMLARELWKRGFRYRKNDKTVYGKPDLTFKKYKIAVFVDSEFWHGKDWETRKYEIKSNCDFWFRKIEGNMARDRQVNEFLTANGWKVIRFWGEQIKKDLAGCVKIVEEALDEAGRKNTV